MDPQLLSLLKEGGPTIALLVLIWVIGNRQVAALDKMASKVEDQTKAVVRIEGKLDGQTGPHRMANHRAQSEAGKVRLGVALAITLLAIIPFAVLALSSGCTKTKETTGRVASDVVDCMTPSAQMMVGEFGPAFADVLRNATSLDGKVDWGPVKAAARPLTLRLSQCVFVAAVAEFLKPKDTYASRSTPYPAELGAEARKVCTELFGNTRYQLEGGVW